MKLSEAKTLHNAIESLMRYDLPPGERLQLTRVLGDLKTHVEPLNTKLQELRVATENAITQKRDELNAVLAAFVQERNAFVEAELVTLHDTAVEVTVPVIDEAELLKSKQSRQIIEHLGPLLPYVKPAAPSPSPEPD